MTPRLPAQVAGGLWCYFMKMDKTKGELSLVEIVQTLALATLSLRGLLDIHERCQVESRYLSSTFLER